MAISFILESRFLVSYLNCDIYNTFTVFVSFRKLNVCSSISMELILPSWDYNILNFVVLKNKNCSLVLINFFLLKFQIFVTNQTLDFRLRYHCIRGRDTYVEKNFLHKKTGVFHPVDLLIIYSKQI